MIDNSEFKAKQIERFCRSHDWGRDAQAYKKPGSVRWFIKNLRDYAKQGENYILVNKTLPANMKTIREWAGY